MYEENHIKFLQVMLRFGCRSLDSAEEFCSKFDNKSTETFISEINEKIEPHSLKLLKAHCEVTAKDYVVLINTSDDDLSMLQQQYTTVELEYFYLLIHELIISDEKRLKCNICLNLASSLPSKSHFTSSQAETLLEKGIEQGYFVQDNTYIYIGPRGIWEFMAYIQTKYEDYCTSCNLCFEMVMFGSACVNCGVMLHKHCLESFLRSNNTCPSCEVDWEHQEDNNGNVEGYKSDESTMEFGD